MTGWKYRQSSLAKTRKGITRKTDKIVAHLRADKNLSDETSEAIIHMIKLS